MSPDPTRPVIRGHPSPQQRRVRTEPHPPLLTQHERERRFHPDGFLPSNPDRVFRHASDRPGAFSLFCCGPQTLARSLAAGRDSLDHASTLVQMQLKTTDTTTGFLEKDIKSMTKLNFTVPHDFPRTRSTARKHGWDLRAPVWSPVPAHAHAGRMEPLPDTCGGIDTGEALPTRARR